MWLWIAGILLVGIGFYPFRGWIGYLIRQRRRETGYIREQSLARIDWEKWSDDRLTVAWLGHATVLMNFYGKWIITDPVLGGSVGIGTPFGFSFGPRRLVKSPLTAEQLPKLDLILQSHAHMDHLDQRTWKQLKPGPAVVMAANNQRYIRHRGFTPVHELAWDQTVDTAGVRVTAVEVKHWGERYPWSKNHGYNAYLLEREGVKVLFGGDTAYTPSFGRLALRHQVQVAILPIGGYDPYIRVHASPEQAWEMFKEMEADYLVPIHHRTFILSHEPPHEPWERLLAAAGREADRVVIREVGDVFAMPKF